MLNVQFTSTNDQFVADFASGSGVDVSFNSHVEVSTNDHSKLLNRDKAEQHPIGAISNLQETLNKKIAKDDALNNLEIENLLNNFV